MPFVTGLSAAILKRMLLWCDFFLTAVHESLCVRACVLEASEGVLMPAANWHTQQMGQRLIPCLLTVHSNVDVCVCVHVCETSHHKPSPVV